MKVRELLSDETKWTQCTFAATKDGHPCDPEARRAAKWCLSGAIERCYGQFHGSFAAAARATAVIRSRVIERIHADIIEWNDSPVRSFGAVKRLVDELDI